MILIVGGRKSGKLDFAKNRFGIDESEIADGEICHKEEIFEKTVIYNFSEIIRRMMKSGENPNEFFAKDIDGLTDKIIICDEVGSGIVPTEKFDREWRENVGRICIMLAKEADRVYRVYCGIGTLIKGEENES